ncbi:MAG: class I SAM-dependent methyltransferase [Verrucomicrobia bacterium]|nr:class I SAM-dependent methyltransferase [Verrucomicrobiota bacterium]
MIIHKLIARHLKHRDDAGFYTLQAQAAIQWIRQAGAEVGSGVTVLDLGCGHGIFGEELQKRGCQVTFADERRSTPPHLADAPFKRIDLDHDDISIVGEYDLVVCSNVFEHLANPRGFLSSVHRILTPNGKLYLSWTNWLSPWGGHEFSPFHYLGAQRGHLIYDKFSKRRRLHTPFENLFPTYIGQTLRMIRTNPRLQLLKAAPRYYTEFAFLMSLPGIRELLAWNCALLLGRKP